MSELRQSAQLSGYDQYGQAVFSSVSLREQQLHYFVERCVVLKDREDGSRGFEKRRLKRFYLSGNDLQSWRLLRKGAQEGLVGKELSRRKNNQARLSGNSLRFAGDLGAFFVSTENHVSSTPLTRGQP
jgi:hypothetical protein